MEGNAGVTEAARGGHEGLMAFAGIGKTEMGEEEDAIRDSELAADARAVVRGALGW
jgi:hypothetical protein